MVSEVVLSGVAERAARVADAGAHDAEVTPEPGIWRPESTHGERGRLQHRRRVGVEGKEVRLLGAGASCGMHRHLSSPSKPGVWGSPELQSTRGSRSQECPSEWGVTPLHPLHPCRPVSRRPTLPLERFASVGSSVQPSPSTPTAETRPQATQPLDAVRSIRSGSDRRATG